MFTTIFIWEFFFKFVFCLYSFIDCRRPFHELFARYMWSFDFNFMLYFFLWRLSLLKSLGLLHNLLPLSPVVWPRSPSPRSQSSQIFIHLVIPSPHGSLRQSSKTTFWFIHRFFLAFFPFSPAMPVPTGVVATTLHHVHYSVLWIPCFYIFAIHPLHL